MQLRRIDNYKDFQRMVNFLYFDDLEELGFNIELDSVLGYFFPWSLPRLVTFCSQHPELHIVSICGKVKINAAVRGASLYILANGVRDPWLVHDPDGEVDEEFYRSLYSRFKSWEPNFTRSA